MDLISENKLGNSELGQEGDLFEILQVVVECTNEGVCIEMRNSAKRLGNKSANLGVGGQLTVLYIVKIRKQESEIEGQNEAQKNGKCCLANASINSLEQFRRGVSASNVKNCNRGFYAAEAKIEKWTKHRRRQDAHG